MQTSLQQLGSLLVPNFPTIVNVEVYRGQCPCRCVHCPVGIIPPGQREQHFGSGEIELSLFRKIVAEMRSYPASLLRIHSTGEPLLWGQLPAALDDLKESGVKSWLFTCAVTRNRALLRTLCETISIVEVSVNSTSQDDYLSTKGIDAFHLVSENIRFMRDVMGQDAPGRLIVSRVESNQLEMDMEFVHYWRSSGLVDDAFIRSRHTYNDLLPEPVCSPDSPIKKGPCLVHWARFNIGLNGEAVICFNELFRKEIDSSLILGQVSMETIAEIWRGSKLNALRQAELTGDYSGIPGTVPIPCASCAHCQPLFGMERNTSEHQIRQVGWQNDQALS